MSYRSWTYSCTAVHVRQWLSKRMNGTNAAYIVLIATLMLMASMIPSFIRNIFLHAHICTQTGNLFKKAREIIYHFLSRESTRKNHINSGRCPNIFESLLGTEPGTPRCIAASVRIYFELISIPTKLISISRSCRQNAKFTLGNLHKLSFSDKTFQGIHGVFARSRIKQTSLPIKSPA